MSEIKKRKKIKQMFSELQQGGTPGLTEEQEPSKKKVPVSRLERNALRNVFPGLDIGDMDLSGVETDEEKEKKKLRLRKLMQEKLTSRK